MADVWRNAEPPLPPKTPSSDRRAATLRSLSACAVLGALLSIAASGARADNAVIPDTPAQLGLRGGLDGALQLQVFVNGADTHEIVAFTRDAAGRFLAKRADLADIGLKAGAGGGEAALALDRIPGLTYRYDENAQTLMLTIPQSQLTPRLYSAAPQRQTSGRAVSDWGAAVNYDLFASSASWWPGEPFNFGSGSLTLDARAFSPLGVVSQSAILGATAFTSQTALRLDTTWRYDDETRAVTYRAGDLVSGGLPWTRPVRLGGFQASHDFGLRPDLVLGPSATVSGSAAVPSSADVFVNNFKIFSQPVEAGPFRIENLPAVSGGGSATVVLRDVTGKEVTQTVPFFVGSRLLAPGALQYSAEGGFARVNYGVASFDYDPHFVASGTLRGGLTDWATLEAHAEGGAGLIEGGAGATLAVFQRGSLDIAAAASAYRGRIGGQIALGASTTIYGATFDASTQRAFGGYADLAEVTAPLVTPYSILSNFAAAGVPGPAFSPYLLSGSLAPPRELDRLSISIPHVFGAVAANVSLVNQVDGDGVASRVASFGLTRSFRNGLSLFATVFADYAARREFGALAGLSYTFGAGASATTQSILQGGQFAQATQIVKPAGQEIGDYGGALEDLEGANRYTRATAAYQSAAGRATVTATQYGAGSHAVAAASGEFSGSFAMLGGGFAYAPRIADSFTMIDAGVPGVTVLEDNRVIGKTGASGRLLATGLRGFQDNRIGIDATTLPPGAQASATEMIVRPRALSGVAADFRIRADARDAEILLTDAAGKPFPTGARIERGGGEGGIVGYDGRAYLADLAAHNVLTLRADGQTCTIEFDYPAKRGAARPTLGPFACKPSNPAARGPA